MWFARHTGTQYPNASHTRAELFWLPAPDRTESRRRNYLQRRSFLQCFPDLRIEGDSILWAVHSCVSAPCRPQVRLRPSAKLTAEEGIAAAVSAQQVCLFSAVPHPMHYHRRPASRLRNDCRSGTRMRALWRKGWSPTKANSYSMALPSSSRVAVSNPMPPRLMSVHIPG